LEALVLRALARRPTDRFRTAHDLVVALDEVAREIALPLSPWALGRYVLALDDGAVDEAALGDGFATVETPGGDTATDLFVPPGLPGSAVQVGGDGPTELDLDEPGSPGAADGRDGDPALDGDPTIETFAIAET